MRSLISSLRSAGRTTRPSLWGREIARRRLRTDTAAPIVLSMSAARDLGYEAVGTYAETLVAELSWLNSVGRTTRVTLWRLPLQIDTSTTNSKMRMRALEVRPAHSAS